ncbi:MAG: long-chain-fatty-acid--CoA ligase [Fluviicoccus sp.]|uniref:long-chain-fatty-acid--CoA ligase n=1 Tax=Fluviicoccus sp. TaxID=2003552 RepID=UPI002723DA71|nr:long-chain-fatty-acid--CoA ligase [Fluviicoccus sp.]MDO8331702.1 long-chain-fatty-acid--CoA ligase [Fluviicoccus sp.]
MSMMQQPLLISSLIEHAIVSHPDAEIVSRKVEGGIHRYTYGEAARRSKQLANALTQKLGVQAGDRIGTLAWNTWRHYELYFGVSGIGAVTHTINPRLFPEQIVYIVNHARDRYIFVDLTFLPLLEAVHDKLPNVEGYVVLTDREHMPAASKLNNLLCYEELIADQSDEFTWPPLDENSGAALCYTSGTTGHPKGVMYTQRSTVLHATAATRQDALNIHGDTVILPVVPMFHVNAWGTPYAATITGAKLVFPGAGMDGASLYELINSEQATLLLGVPTVWLGLLNYLDQINAKLHSVHSVVVGGSAAPLAMIKAFDQKHDAFLIHAWGMTELSPLGTINNLNKKLDALPREERYQRQLKQGRPVYGVEIKIADEEGNELPRDGKTFGRLLVRGPWVAGEYYLHDDKKAFADGWFDTGDVATIDAENTMQIVDRSKDVIKSGGEWISSIDLENAAVGHPGLKECCVIGVYHPKWDERPLLLAIRKEGSTVTEQEVLDFLKDKIVKWWMPDAVVFVDELPHTATGKLLKTGVREQYKNWLVENGRA